MRNKPSRQVTGNLLLDGLAPEILARFLPFLDPVPLKLKQVIYEPGKPIEQIYFPVQGLLSIVVTMSDGASADSGLIGNDGMAGTPIVLGVDSAPHRVVAQIAGRGLRFPAALMRQELIANAVLRARLLRYVQSNLNAVSQTAACNRLHRIEQRCARWLLQVHDRIQGDSFRLTHELLAVILGVRRPGITVAARSLQENGLITYTRGAMTILDRKGLEGAACECYRVIKEQYDWI